jgi:hypothetical protein
VIDFASSEFKEIISSSSKISNLDKGNQEIPHFAEGLLTSNMES